MSRYALLVSPSANRVYARAAAALTVAELGVLGATVLARRLGDARPEEVAGVEYVGFDGELDEASVRHLANVSTAFALFERTSGRPARGTCRSVPCPRPPSPRAGSSGATR